MKTDKDNKQIHTDKENENNYNTLNEQDDLTLLLKTEQEFTDEIPIIDQIFNSYGYGPITWKFIIFTFLVLLVEGLEMTLFSSLLIPLRNYYNLTNTYVQLTSSIIFFAFGLGSFAVGYMTRRFSRSLILKISLSLILIFHIAMSLMSSKALFILFRVLVGFFIGIAVPVSLSLLTEHLPLKMRGFTLTLVWIGYSVGQVVLLIMSLIIMPNLEVTKIQTTLLVSAIFPILALIIHLFLLEDSPRHLLILGENNKAFEILERLNKRTISKTIKDKILHQVHTGVNEHMKTEFKDIFHGMLLKLSILLLFIWTFSAIIQFGPILIASLTLEKLGMKDGGTNKDIITKQIWIHSMSAFAKLFGGLLSETRLGRVKTSAIGFSLCIVFLILLMVFPNQFTIFFGLVSLVRAISYNVNISYSSEVYPTKLRDMALGVLFSANRLGGFISQIIYVSLDHWYIWAPYIFTIIICVISVVLILFLPFETKGQYLDKNYVHKRENVIEELDRSIIETLTEDK